MLSEQKNGSSAAVLLVFRFHPDTVRSRTPVSFAFADDPNQQDADRVRRRHLLQAHPGPASRSVLDGCSHVGTSCVWGGLFVVVVVACLSL